MGLDGNKKENLIVKNSVNVHKIYKKTNQCESQQKE